MSRKTQAISDEMVVRCKAELKRQGVRGENGRRLQAILSAKEHGILQVAKIYNISRETLMRWIRKFSEGGSEAFTVAVGRGRHCRLTNEQKNELRSYIEEEGATLTAKNLQLEIEERFEITLSETTVHRLIKALGFSYITPRPSHYKKDSEAQEKFKKKS